MCELKKTCILAMVFMPGLVAPVLADRSFRDCDGSPRVFFSFANAADLADTSQWDRWKYVREHLDGFWMNAAGNGGGNPRATVERVKPENVIVIQGIIDHDPLQFNGTADNWIDRIPSWSYQPVIEGAAIVNDYDPDQDYWSPTDMGDAKNMMVPSRVPEVYKLDRLREWRNENLEDPSDPIHQLAEDADGGVLELSPVRMREAASFRSLYENFHQGYHSRGKKVMWLMTPGTADTITAQIWVDSFVWCYNSFKALDILPDVFIIAYHTSTKNWSWFPESRPDGTAAATVTGGAYALLKLIEEDFCSTSITMPGGFTAHPEWPAVHFGGVEPPPSHTGPWELRSLTGRTIGRGGGYRIQMSFYPPGQYLLMTSKSASPLFGTNCGF